VLMLPVLAAVSCFEKDQAVPPYMLPENIDTLSIPHSIYDYQEYFDFSSGTIVSENKNSEWVLSFECADSGYHIRINSGDLWALAHTGSGNMDSAFTANPDYLWKADRSDGNPDSTALGKWVSFSEGVPDYTNEVYLLGQYDGITHNLVKKFQFISVNEEGYTFLMADVDSGDPDTFRVLKDERFNYTQFSVKEKRSLQLEPEKDSWDLLFTQYFTILYTEDSVPTPYYVRGALLNPNKVEAALDTIVHFLDVTYADAIQKNFSSDQDIIGYDWKSVSVDEASSSAEYRVRPGYTYIVRDTDNELYKLRFTSYLNKSGIKGYPSIEFAGLDPE
jgi:hypothetical protein